MDREKYDYRTTQFKRKDQPQFNSKYMNILQNIEKVRQARQDLIDSIREFKAATDIHYEKTRVKPYF